MTEEDGPLVHVHCERPARPGEPAVAVGYTIHAHPRDFRPEVWPFSVTLWQAAMCTWLDCVPADLTWWAATEGQLTIPVLEHQ